VPGEYVVTQDLQADSGDCIYISSSNVVLDCAGHSIQPTASPSVTPQAGVALGEVENVMVKNCVIQNFVAGNGVRVDAAFYSTIENNVLTGNGNGVTVFTPSNVFKNNVLNSNLNNGVFLNSGASGENVFLNNEVKFNTCGGVRIDASNAVFTGGVVRENNDSTCGSGFALDFVLNESSNLTLSSVEFNKNNQRFYDGESKLFVKWLASVLVTDLDNNPVENASVTVRDVNSSVVYSGTTSAEGSIPTLEVLEYVQTLSSLSNSTPHSFTAAKNGFSNSIETLVTQNTSIVIQLPFERAPPAISNVRVIDVTQNTVTLAWDTNEPANETLEYGTTTSYENLFTNSTLATSHSVLLTGLLSGVTYHYRVNACDVYGNCAFTSDYSFTTISGGTSSGSSGTSSTSTPTSTPSTSATPNASSSSETPSAPSETRTASLGENAVVTQSFNGTHTTFELKYAASGAFDGYIEWELPIDCADYLNGLVYFTPQVSSVSCGSIKAVWEVKFLKTGEEFNSKVSVRKQLPPDAVNEVKKPKLTPRETTRFEQTEQTASVLPTLSATASTEAPQPATGLVAGGPANNYFLAITSIAIAIIAAIALALYAKKRKTTNAN